MGPDSTATVGQVWDQAVSEYDKTTALLASYLRNKAIYVLIGSFTVGCLICWFPY